MLEIRTLPSSLPVAIASANPSSIYEGEDLWLDGTASYDDDMDPLSYAWDVNGDGAYGEVIGDLPSVLWSDLQSYGLGDDGIYTIGLEVSDGVDGSGYDWLDVTVMNMDPMVMDFSILGTPAYPGETITVEATFEDPAEAADSYTYVVDWGDGTSTDPNGTPVSYGSTISAGHEYPASGDYFIEVTVTDDDGGWGSWSESVTIDPNLDPIFDQGSYSFTVLETAEPPAEVGTVSATDPEGELPKYALGLGPGVQGPLQFNINEDTGLITVASSLNYETQPSHSLIAYATDSAGHQDTADVLITVEDVGVLAVDDVMYAGQGDPGDNSVTFYVLENDEHWAGELLTITAVTQPANGTVAFTDTDITYTPDPGFYSGTDTFEYTIAGDYGETDTATVTVNMVEVTSWTLERQDDTGNWVPNGSGEIAWWDEELRWTAQYSADVPEPPVNNEWKAQPWEDYQNGTGSWQVFTGAPGDTPAEGSPGEGAWAILPVLYFADLQTQSGFTAQLAAANQVAQGIAKVEIHEWNTGTILSATTQTVIVGQNIHLFAYVTPAILNLQALFGNVEYEWTIPGATTDKAIKSYTMTLDEGKWEDLETADLDGLGVNFYWIDQLNGEDVTVEVTIGGRSRTAKVTYDVLRPTVDMFDSLTTGDRPAIDVDDPGFGTGDELHFGINGDPGIKWAATVTTPAGGAGKIAFTQLLNEISTRTKDDGTAQVRSSGGDFVLDDGLGVQYSGTTAIGASDTKPHVREDIPGNKVAGLKKTAADNKFELYLMYKPDGTDSIWVTLGKLEWNWKGSATKDAAGVWTVDAGSAAYSPNPVGAASTHLPTWDDKYTALGWH